MVRRLKKIIKAFMPYGLLLIWNTISWDKYGNSKKFLKKHYHKNNVRNQKYSASQNTKKIIYFADGRRYAAGLADRLSSIISLYMIARDMGVDFKINFTSPVSLINYLVPNKYDWTIAPNDIIYDVRESAICDFGLHRNVPDVVPKIKNLLEQYTQLHVTADLFIAEIEYGALFDFLFKPSPELQALIDYHLSQIGGNFISASFRFMALLGDFNEAGSALVLPEADRQALITRCLEHLQEIHDENNGEKILVTSDSITFVNKAKKFDFVYVAPGEIAHIDNAAGLDKAVHMKTFLDYMLLTYSQKLYLVVDGNMYRSGFAYRASLHKSRFVIKRYQ